MVFRRRGDACCLRGWHVFRCNGSRRVINAKVVTGYWAPIGSQGPEECFPGFYCPGFTYDNVNTIPGSRPIIIDSGDRVERSNRTVLSNVTISMIQTNLTLDAEVSTFNETDFKYSLSVLYGVPIERIRLGVSGGSRLQSRLSYRSRRMPSGHRSDES